MFSPMKPPVSSRQREALFRKTKGEKRDEHNALAGAAALSGNGQAAESAKPKPDRAKRRKYVREFAGWLWPYRFAIAAVTLLSLISAALDMVWPMAIKSIID